MDALAGEIDKVRRALDTKAGSEDLDRLASVVAELADAVNIGRERGEPAPPASWLALPTSSDAAAGLLADLVEWLGTVYLRYADAVKALPECWLWHPDIVEELCWLMSAWLAAYQGDDASVRAAADWHDRLRPGVVRRIGKNAACSLENHLPSGRAATSSPRVPVVDAVDAIAAWWDQARDQRAPAPTDDQMIAAAAAARRARTGGDT